MPDVKDIEELKRRHREAEILLRVAQATSEACYSELQRVKMIYDRTEQVWDAAHREEYDAGRAVEIAEQMKDVAHR